MNYLIVSPARCGSSWLQNTIVSTLNINYVKDFNWENYPDFTAEQIINQKSPWCGKLFTDEIHLYNKPIDWWASHATLVFLYRKDILDHFLSFVFARHSKIFNIDNGHTPVYNKVTILDDDYLFYESIWNSFVSFDLPDTVDILTYENMKADVKSLLNTTPAEISMKKLLTFDEKIQLLNTDINVVKRKLEDITGIENIRDFKWGHF